MTQRTNFNSNNTENGWIYKQIYTRMDNLEESFKTFMTTLEKAEADLNISLSDYFTIIDALSSKTETQSFNRHNQNGEIHVDPTSRNIWNNKLDLRDIDRIEVGSNDEISDLKIKVILKTGDTFYIPYFAVSGSTEGNPISAADIDKWFTE